MSARRSWKFLLLKEAIFTTVHCGDLSVSSACGPSECAEWQSDIEQFCDCGQAFLVYEKCQAARGEYWITGGISDDGVPCEHPTYQVHARDRNEIEKVLRAHGDTPPQ